MSPPRLVSIVQSFLKVSSSSSRVRIRPLRSLRIICFRNFSQHTHAPPLKPLLAPSPACFNHSIIFESLLLQISRANPPCSGPLIFEITLTATIHPKKGAAGTPMTALQSRRRRHTIASAKNPQSGIAAGTHHDGSGCSARTSRRGAVGTRGRRD